MESNLLILFLFLKSSVPGWAMKIWPRISYSRREGWQRGLFPLLSPNTIQCRLSHLTTLFSCLDTWSPNNRSSPSTVFPHRALFLVQQPSANQGLGLHPGQAYPGPMAGTVPRAPDTFGGPQECLHSFQVQRKNAMTFLVEENVLIYNI